MPLQSSYLNEIAGVISFSAYVIYIVSVFKGKTKPSRSTWWILTIVGSLILTTSYSIGAKESLWVMLSYVIGPLGIAVVSLHPKYGYGSRLLPIDIVCLLSAVGCLVIWLFFHSPMIAFAGSIVIDCIGLIPTVKKAYEDPKDEHPLAWGIEMTASIINAIGITAWFSLTEKDWIYALYLLLGNGTILAVLLIRSALKPK